MCYAARVRWWLWAEDGAVHAFRRTQLGHGRAILETVCGREVFAFQVERHDRGLRCLVCRLIVGPN